MAKTLAQLLAGENMEGGENFCDSVYNFLKNQGKDINLFTNSGFGVWSQSDTNKGLATLNYDVGSAGGGDVPDVGDAALGATSGATGKIISYTITGGAFATNNAVGVLTLGAVRGCFQDNETINFTDGETALVNGDANVGVENDPMNNNSVGLWTDDGAGITLAFVAAEYTVTTNAGNQRAWIANAALTAGKIYKIELDIKDGTAAGADIEGYLDDGAAQYGKIETTAAGWASVSWTFECATTTGAGKVGLRIPTSLAASNIEIRRFSCYEITPCCTAADNKAFDGWDKDATCDIYRQHWDSTYSKCGSFYSLKIVPTVADDYVRFPGAFYDNEEWYKQFCGQPVTVGAWVYASVASHAKLVIQQTSGDTSSAYHSGTPGWEWLEITEEIADNTVFFDIQLFCDATPNVDGTTIVYISQDMLIFGWSLGEGMYQPIKNELVWHYTDYALNSYNASTIDANANINLEAESDAKVPKGARAIYCRLLAINAGASEVFYSVDDLTNQLTGIYMRSQVGAIAVSVPGYQPCDSNGDIGIARSGTWTSVYVKMLGIQVN